MWLKWKNNDFNNKYDDICAVFDFHNDVVNRIKTHIPEESDFSELSEFFKYLENLILKIISLLCITDLCFCNICEVLDLNQTTI